MSVILIVLWNMQTPGCESCWAALQLVMQQCKCVSVEKESCVTCFHFTTLSLFLHLLSLFYHLSPGYFVSLSPPTPLSPVSPLAFILPGCFLYKNTPIGWQAPLSDTIHCTCVDMKSVLTSTAEFCSVVETAYQWQCRSCDWIKEAVKFGKIYVDVLVRR